MTISTEEILVVMGAASTITTAIFWGAWYLGRLGNQMNWLTGRVEAHEKILEIIGRRAQDPPV